MITIESADSTWHFDLERKRFHWAATPSTSSTGTGSTRPRFWCGYHDLVVDPESGTFVVRLDAGGRRTVRATGRVVAC